jgi:acetylornithine deacetylase
MDDEGKRLRALAALDERALVRDLSALVREPSVTGSERGALERLAAMAADAGLAGRVDVHDLERLRASAGYPGEEAPRDELAGLTVTLPGGGDGRLCLNGHVDVVAPGAEPWHADPFGGTIRDGRVHGCGAADMKAGVVAALHAMAAVRRALGGASAEVVLQAVSSEEDGGLGTFAALEADDRFDACVIPEPTAFRIVVAHAGALTFSGTVRGTAAHAAVRLEGVSAIDRYVVLHAALAEHERRVNRDVGHPLMRELALPYPLLVGRIEAGRWSSQVPDELRFEGRLGVRVGQTVADARADLERAVAAAHDGLGPPVEIAWSGGQFEAAETPVGHPFVSFVRETAAAELGHAPPLAGAPYGADMRFFANRGIPCVMLGTPGLERAHAADEYVVVEDVVRVARALIRMIVGFTPAAGRTAAPRRSRSAGSAPGSASPARPPEGTAADRPRA